MKHIYVLLILVAGAMVLPLMAAPASAATQAQIDQAITNGLAWLVSQQNGDGSWGTSWQVARTGFAVVKLEERAFELGYASPFDDAYPYNTNVIKGLNYLFSQAATYGTNAGICFAQTNQETYCTGVAMMAIAASRAPDRIVSNVPGSIVTNMTYKAVLQSNVAYFAWSQNPDGGWRYWASNEPSDNSNSGFAVLGLRYAEAPIYGFACVIPGSIKAGLTNFIAAIQDPVNGDADDGGSWYTASYNWVNLLKTGNLLFEMSFVGDNASVPRVTNAVAYIERHWNDNNSDPGWRPHHYQAMYCLMQGFESLGIETITVGGSNVDWFAEFASAIVASQQSDGSWPADYWGDAMLATEWALLVLEKEVAISPPVADFTGNPTYGAEILAVTFNDTSTGSPSGYRHWDFGNGTLDTTETNFVHNYAAGVWTVSLTVTNAGGSSNLTRTNYVTVLSHWDWWRSNYFGCVTCAQAAAHADPDGDGMSNTNEFLAGFNPTNNAAYLHIISIVETGNDVNVTYLGANGDTNWTPGIQSRTNILEYSTGNPPDGSYTNDFSPVPSAGATNILSGGTGLGVVTNMVDIGGATNSPSRYYRVRLVP